MDLKEYKALKSKTQTETVVDLELPSGFIIKVRPFPMKSYAELGRLPHLFTAQQANALDGKTIDEAEIMDSLTGKDFLESAEFLKKVFDYCCIAPRICSNPNEDEIAPEDMPENDLAYLQGWCLSGGVAQPLAAFRTESEQPLASRARKPKLQMPTEQADAPRV